MALCSCRSPSGLKGAVSLGPAGERGLRPAAPLTTAPQSPDQRTPRDASSPAAPPFRPGHSRTPPPCSVGVPGWGGPRTQAAQGLQGCGGQGFVEDGHGPQLALQGGGAAPARVLGACKGGADAALLRGGPRPGPPAQPRGGRDGLGAGEGGVSGRRQPRGGGGGAVAGGADAAGREGLRGRGWGVRGGQSAHSKAWGAPASSSAQACTDP